MKKIMFLVFWLPVLTFAQKGDTIGFKHYFASDIMSSGHYQYKFNTLNTEWVNIKIPKVPDKEIQPAEVAYTLSVVSSVKGGELYDDYPDFIYDEEKYFRNAFAKLKSIYFFPLVEFGIVKNDINYHTIGTGFMHTTADPELLCNSIHYKLNDFNLYYQYTRSIYIRKQKKNIRRFYFMGGKIAGAYKSLSYKNCDTWPYGQTARNRTDNSFLGLLQLTLGKRIEGNRLYTAFGINLNVLGYVNGHHSGRDTKTYDEYNPDTNMWEIVTEVNNIDRNYSKFLLLFPLLPDYMENQYHFHSIYFKVGYRFY